MSENIGKLTTPSGDGASIEVHDTKINITASLTNPSNGNLSYLNDNKHIATILSGENNYNDGSCVLCFSNNSTNNPGQLWLRTQTGIGPNVLKVTTKPDELTINNKQIDSIYSSGSNYIQYTNGLCFNFGRTVIPANSYSASITFSQSYIENQLPIANVTLASDYINSTEFKLSTTITSTQLTIYCTSNGLYNMDRNINYFVIGYWK